MLNVYLFLTFFACFLLFNYLPFLNGQVTNFHAQKLRHTPFSLDTEQLSKLSHMSNITHIREVLDNICVERVVGTPGHATVKQYIKDSMERLDWTVESDKFTEKTPNLGVLQFENIIAKLNPNAKRYLALACHYDSKYTEGATFVGATDSAVPCAQLINLAAVMQKQLNSVKERDVSLMFIFFDGEEAFQYWGPKDSIYGARHLANKWHKTKKNYEWGNSISDLDKLDMLVLLDLIGASDPTFYNYFPETERWYSLLVDAEGKLADLRKFESYSYGKPQQRYFQPYSVQAHIEDDHTPFLRKKVPIVHVIPYPFPTFWHEPEDNLDNVDMKTVENLNKILRIFVASYLHINV